MVVKATSKKARQDLDGPRNGYAFSASDWAILARYETIAEAIALIFGSSCEVVVHSLENMAHSVVKIVNNQVTGRSLGSPITDLGLEMLKKAIETKEDLVGPYFSTMKAGKQLKSVTMLIRNNKGIPIGLMCINVDLSVPVNVFLKEFVPSNEYPQSDEIFASDVGSLVTQAVTKEFEAVSRITGVSPTEKSRKIVYSLEQQGVFDIKGAVELVASELGVTRHTIYKYLREMRCK